jgi:multidrug efflux system outer membrane protein
MKTPPFIAVAASATTAAALLLAGCAMGPNYKRPEVETPAQYKEQTGPWKKAAPQDAIAKGAWWEIFHDSFLSDLERAAETNNQSLKAAVARVTQARATARLSASQFYPNISLDPSAQEIHQNANALFPPGETPQAFTGTDYQVPFDLSYELDIWGRVRRSFESSNEKARASVSDYENVLLTLKADVAQDYFSLRALDSQRDLLDRTVDIRKKALDLTQNRFKGGASSELDVAQAETELHSVQAQAIDTDVQRAQLEHAIAVLVGKPASSFSIPRRPFDPNVVPPVIPPGLPSDLLERRPDVATAERLMASANAQIGASEAAFFPTVRLTGDFGWESKNISNIFDWSSRSWGIGPQLSIPIFDAGANNANLRNARGAYDESAANYRQQVLQAFADVEDGLSGLRILAEEADAQGQTVTAAQKADDISVQRYVQGLVNYLQIVDAEQTLLNNQRIAITIQGQRFVTAVVLVKALGGGWNDATLIPYNTPRPGEKTTLPVSPATYTPSNLTTPPPPKQ